MEFKGTKEGKFKIDKRNGVYYIVSEYGVVVADVDDMNNLMFNNPSLNEIKPNAELICEAFNVRQQINCSLTELLEQRDEAVELLKEVDYGLSRNTYDKIQILLTKIQSNE